MAEITVAIVQMQPILGDLEANLYHMAETIERICSEEDTDLIVFPELATTGVENGVGFNRLAERIPGHQFNVLATKAADFSTYVVFGLPTKEKVESIFYNAAVVIGPDGELVGEYRKIHLKGEEKLSFRPGYRFNGVRYRFRHAGRHGRLGHCLPRSRPLPRLARRGSAVRARGLRDALHG